ncbi:CRISPR-associated protein Cmr6 [Thermoflavimicrobium dichotomicum]|uniref:CRISPR-associated protein Cmr6 n=1 Tax=Thermoflavimicrobium dichotomicum TaxID=46223 RepID=A0A1I3USD4_9BACL|nr:CRISPR-associated protein Cmr6 [Thermoflavimicrobium dichotomicum]
MYQADRHLHHGRLPSKHAGLWYHKFCHDWVQYDESQLWYLGDDKLKWMEKIQGKTGSDRLIQRAVSRLEKLVQAQKGILLYCRTISRFITGIGLSPPTEVGFAWHPTLGTSYMPGSSLKGAIRSWARDWLKLDEKTCMRLFGSEPHKAQKQMGNVIFFDVLPTDRIRIEVDVITPHFDSCYQNPQKNPALEWFNPRPIPCLTVAEGQPFVFAIAPVRQDAQGQDDVLRIKKMILQALEWTGVGAKTAVGYGRFELVKERSFVDG